MDVAGLAFASLTAAALVGAFLVWRGLRGRVVDDHPICRRCGFDLFGRPEASDRCPECGSDLSTRKAIRIGRRERRPRALAGGIALILPWALLMAAVGAAWYGGTDVNRYKPVWWLIREAHPASVGELSRRQFAGELSDEQLATFLDAALATQADVRRPWLSGWGDAIERARLDGKLSDALWQRYAKQAVPIALKARPRVRVGDPVPVEVHFDGVRVASSTRLDAHLRMMRASIDGRRLGGLLPEETAGGGVFMSLGGRSSGWAIKEVLRADAETLAPLVGGPRTVRAEVAVSIYDSGNPSSAIPPVCSDDVVVSDTIAVVPPNEPTVELVRGDAALRDRLNLLVKVERPSQVVSSSGPVVTIDNARGARLMIRADKPPIGLALQVLLRDARPREYPLNEISFLPDTRGTWYASMPLDGFDADVVDVVLRPSPLHAVETVELTRIWDEEIIIPNVPVYWSDEAIRPTVAPQWMKLRGTPPPKWFWLNEPRPKPTTRVTRP